MLFSHPLANEALALASEARRLGLRITPFRLLLEYVMSLWISALLAHACRALFTCVVLVYACVYQSFRGNYISVIYQRDKYGVVLLYLVLSAMNLYNQHQRMAPCSYTLQRALGNVPSETVSYAYVLEEVVADYQRLLVILTCLRVIFFSLIFKNHTSSTSTHQGVHRLMVLPFASCALLAKIGYSVGWQRIATFAQQCRLLPDGLPDDTGILWRSGLLSALTAVIAGVVCKVVAGLQQRGKWPRWAVVNLIVTFAEAVVIEQTM